MSDAQRLAHNRERYWNGPLTRAEAQRVFDETAGVIQKTQETLVKLDLVIAYLVEKSGAATADIQAWMDNRIKEMQAKMQAAQHPVDARTAEPTITDPIGLAAETLPGEPALVTLD